MSFATTEEIIADIRAGRMVVVVDDEDRENEGDIIIAAEYCSAEQVNFMLQHARGVICVPLPEERCDELQLHPQAAVNNTQRGTAFTVSVDASRGITTGVSATERAHTIRLLGSPACKPSDLVRPGHINPLAGRKGGVLVRAGHTEGSLDLVRLAGLNEAAVVCEILRPDGEMARLDYLNEFCKQHGLKLGTIAQIIEYRRSHECHVKREATVRMPTKLGEFSLHYYRNTLRAEDNHLALAKGMDGFSRDNPCDEPVLVRVHSQCMTGDIFHSLRCDCGEQLEAALAQIERAGRGVLLYLQQEGRGIGLLAKLQAYHIQDTEGADTVEANVRLGFKPDLREYGIGAQILVDLGVKKMRMLSNNPKKLRALEGYGLELTERVPIEMEANDQNRRYLEVKREKMGHLLKMDTKPGPAKAG
jgi:3,4-dihydroxy 2-butanone 4-phosphate synthase/GTP cyclohydrolase II